MELEDDYFNDEYFYTYPRVRIFDLYKSMEEYKPYYKFQELLRKILIGHEVQFNGVKVKFFDIYPKHHIFSELIIKVEDVYITKDGDHASAIYLKDDKLNYYYATCRDMEILDEEYKKKIQHHRRIKKEEIKKKKDELKIKMLNVDPYGEEEWMEEKIITKFKKFENKDMIHNYDEFLNEKYYDDLTPYVYDGSRGLKNPVNIGWLDKGQDYETGEVPEGFLKKLGRADIIGRHKGSHRCPFCAGADSSNVLYVKGKDKTYVFPEMLSHYIRKHNYKPPQEFIDVVMAIPEPVRREQYKASKAKGYYRDDLSWIK